MRNSTLLPLAACLLGLGLSACKDTPKAGAKGGECRFGSKACDDGLACYLGECVDTADVPPDPPSEDDFSAAFTLTKNALQPDGQDTAVIAIDLVDRVTGAPAALPELLARTYPPHAAHIDNAVVELKKGHGVMQIQACDATAEDCPATFRVVFVARDYPTKVLAQTEDITNIGIANRPKPDAALPDAGVPTGDGGAVDPNAPPLTPDQIQAVLDEQVAATADCTAFAATYPGPAQLVAKTVCDTCAAVWRDGGGAYITYRSTETGTISDLKHGGLTQLSVTAPYEDQPLNCTVSAHAGSMALHFQQFLATPSSGCAGALSLTGDEDFFSSACTNLEWQACGGFAGTILDGRRALIMGGEQTSACVAENGDASLEPPPQSHLYLCINAVTQ